MHDATSQFSFSNFRLAIAPGVPSSHLSALLALQRAEEPEVTISFHEVTADDLIAGLREGRYDAGMTLEGSSDPSLKSQPESPRDSWRPVGLSQTSTVVA